MAPPNQATTLESHGIPWTQEDSGQTLKILPDLHLDVRAREVAAQLIAIGAEFVRYGRQKDFDGHGFPPAARACPHALLHVTRIGWKQTIDRVGCSKDAKLASRALQEAELLVFWNIKFVFVINYPNTPILFSFGKSIV